MDRRTRFIKWLALNVAKLEPGCILPKWLYVIQCILFPFLCMAAKVYDPCSATYTIRGLRISAFVIRYFAESTLPGRWIRLTRRENGIVEIETKEE